MNWKGYLALFLLSASIIVFFAIFQTAPGYMDAEYYFGMGLRIAKDRVMSEPFLWNYLNDIRVLPHPAFTYWQPVPAFISSVGILLTGIEKFFGARVAFLIIACFVPLITARLGWELTKDRRVSLLAGLLSIFPVYYAPFMGTTDSFGIMMILGAVYLIASNKAADGRFAVFWGITTGLIHLTRSDGVIWLFSGLLFCAFDEDLKIKTIGAYILGYLIIMGPWFWRNISATGGILPSGTSRMFWLTEYNDLFVLDPQDLTFSSWISHGVGPILKNVFQAFGSNMKTTLFVQGQLILSPLIGLGLWSKRREAIVIHAGIIYGLLFLLMTVIFPFAGWRGGFFHAGAGLQPLFWVLAAVGFTDLIKIGEQKRDWKEKRATLMFGIALVLILASATGYVFKDRVIGDDLQRPAWEKSESDALTVAGELERLGMSADSLIMINNPPGLYAATGRSSIVIPSGPVDDLLKASEEFGVDVLVLEANHPPDLNELYENPNGNNQIELISSKYGTYYFRLK